MIKHINIWKKYRLEKKVITEGARLNILNQVPSNATLAFDEQGSNSFNRDFYLLCLKPDSPYEPKEITRYSLRCIFKSTNCAAFIEENFNRIVEVIDETFSIGTLQEYLIHFNHKRGNSLKLYKKVVEKFVEVLKPYFYLDAIGIMRQLSELRFNFTHPGKVLTDSLVDWFTNKADFYSLSTNI